MGPIRGTDPSLRGTDGPFNCRVIFPHFTITCLVQVAVQKRGIYDVNCRSIPVRIEMPISVYQVRTVSF